MSPTQARETVRGKASATREALLTGPVFPQVVRFGIPTMISMLTPAIYNTTAAYFVSDLGTTAIAALGIVFALHMIMASIGIMAGQGCASQTSRLLGAGEDEAAGFIAGTGIVVSLLGGVLLTLLGLTFVEPLLSVLGATPTIMPDAKAYAQVLLMCAPIISVGITFCVVKALRLSGCARCSRAGSLIWFSRHALFKALVWGLMARLGLPSLRRR